MLLEESGGVNARSRGDTVPPPLPFHPPPPCHDGGASCLAWDPSALAAEVRVGELLERGCAKAC